MAPDEAPLLREIERLLKRTLPVATLPAFKMTSAPAAPAAAAARESAPGGAHRQAHRPPGAFTGKRRGGTRSYAPNSFSRARRSV